MKIRDMPLSYQDYDLFSETTGAPLPRNDQERMQMAPEVYNFIRQIGARPSRLQQGLRAVGRGLMVAGGAGVAVGVANSLFNKPSDNYRQSVTDNQTTGEKDARKSTQTVYDDAYSTGSEEYTGETSSSRASRSRSPGFSKPFDASDQVVDVEAVSVTDKSQNFLNNLETAGLLTGSSGQTQYDSPVGPHSVGSLRGRTQYGETVGPHSLASATGIGRKPRMAKLGGSEFSQALRYGDPAANVAAVKAENEAALRGESPKAVTGAYGPQELMGQGGMSISSGEEGDYRRKTGQNLDRYGLTGKTKPERRGQFVTGLILDPDSQQNKQQREQTGYAASPRYQEEQFQGRMSRDTYVPPSNNNDPTLTGTIDQFINKTKSGKNLPEKKTPKISNIGEGTQLLSDIGSAAFKSMAQGGDMGQRALEQTPDIDLSEIENDPTLTDIGRREEPKDISPRGSIPPDKSGTINKTDLGAIGDIIGEKQSDNPIVGGLQGIGKAARIADKLGRRTVEELADKGAKDRRNYAKYEETVRKAKAFKKIAEDRENT